MATNGAIMVMIQVDEKDVSKTFAILSTNGRFSGFPDNKFRIDENAEATLKKLKDAGIEYKIIDGK